MLVVERRRGNGSYQEYTYCECVCVCVFEQKSMDFFILLEVLSTNLNLSLEKLQSYARRADGGEYELPLNTFSIQLNEKEKDK